MKILSKLERAEQILTEHDMQEFVKPTPRLPEASAEEEGNAYVLTFHQTGYRPAHTYKCVKDGDTYVWKLINYREENPTAKCTNIWANSVRDETTGRATVYIHWQDPQDTADAHWSHSVIIKKKGDIPMDLHDGELVGMSSIRDQYAGKTGFVDSLPNDCVDDNDIIEDLEIAGKYAYELTTDEYRNINKTYYLQDVVGYREALPKDFPADGYIKDKGFYEDPNRYYYNVFAISIFGVSIAGDGCGPCLSWKKFQELVHNGISDHALDLGDVIQIKHTGLGRTLDFQVVAFDNATMVNKDLVHSVTFMACDVLFRGSFDHAEPVYAPTPDETWQNKPYYHQPSPGTFVAIQTSEREGCTPKTYADQPVYERNPLAANPANVFDDTKVRGRNTWKDSNARQWLNSDKDEMEWFSPQHIFDEYSNDVNTYGAYGMKEFEGRSEQKFPGFRHGLDEELQEVMCQVEVKTTKPVWDMLDGDDLGCYEPTYDWVFLPAYVEIFGVDEAFPLDVSPEEGIQFDYFVKKLAKTRMKWILDVYNTTPQFDETTDPNDQLASWWMRTPARMREVETGTENVDCVEMVTSKNRRFDDIRDLDEDGGTGRQAYMMAHSDTMGDIPRDHRNNQFTPEGTTLVFHNNTSPGFVPCFVVGG